MERGCAGVGSGWAGAYRGSLRQWENRLKTGALRSRIRVFLRGKTVELDVRPSGAASANDRKEAGRRRLTLLSILVVQQTLTATIGQNRSWTNNSNQTSGRQVEFRQRTRTLSWRSILPIWPVFVTTAPSIS
jgi:hypothetical protein